MRELELDVRVRKAHLVEEGRRNTAKTVTSHPVLVTKALERFEDGVVRHRSFVITLARKDIRREPVKLVETAQRVDGLPRERHDVRRSLLDYFYLAGNRKSRFLVVGVRGAPWRRASSE
jgi:hypothetical protein